MRTPVRIILFGPPAVEGVGAAALLAQPKRLALFAYIALGQPGGFVRRDQLTALFWPEHDAAHARAALRKSVHGLRALIGADAIPGRGDEELGVDSAHVWVDAVAFHSAMRAERFTDAEALYRGPLLDGVHADAPGFEEWLTIERRRCQEDAVVASWAMARRLEGENSITLASRHARQAARLAESDERMLRNAIKLLERGGDRAGALQLYQEFCERLKRDLDVEPSAETRALVAALRSS